ncbi:unnamed protein product [Enterobius vermicularis]|uniref:Polysacc_synt_C domain-containing protein n=1 Tax=Enterobius vermicularis TaxID=51028 RepID=A0A0N4V6U8_ENTVE|nr:unnamed protein product [Enterobius vermicularis]
MMVIDRIGLEIVTAEMVIFVVVEIILRLFILFGGAIPYIFQYLEILEKKDAQGFSLYVCLALFVANILRILFWFGKNFALVLLGQSIVMIICMALMLEISVRMNRRNLPKSKRASIWRKFCS